jgi:hypothetical protein
MVKNPMLKLVLRTFYAWRTSALAHHSVRTVETGQKVRSLRKRERSVPRPLAPEQIPAVLCYAYAGRTSEQAAITGNMK